MKRLVTILCVASFWSAAGIAQQANPPGPPDKSPLLEKGDLQQVQGLLEPVFRFTFDGPRLKVDRKSWESVPLPGARVGGLEQAHPLEGILWQIQSATGGGGGTTSVS